MNLYKIRGFTFVELLIVITILAFIGAIGFYTLMGYLEGARDSSKITALNNIKTTLVGYKLNKGIYPNPTDYVNIVYSGATIWNQGTFGKNVIKKVNGSKENILDPYTSNEYIYSVTGKGKEFQISGVLEKNTKNIVLGDYNLRILSTKILGIDNILAIPSIISNDLSSINLLDIVKNQKYLSSNNLIIFSGSLSDFNLETNRLNLLNNIKQAYKGTVVESIGGNYFKDINIDLINPSSKVLSLACDIVEFDLNYPIKCNNDSFFAIPIFNINLLNIDFSGLISQNVNVVFQDSSGNIWFGTDKGLSKYSGGIWISYTTGNSLIDNNIKIITQTNNGNIWVGTQGGISVFTPLSSSWTSYTTGNGLINNNVKIVTQINNGNIWVGTQGGVSVFNPLSSNWTFYTTSNGLVNKEVKTITQSPNNNVWVGTEKGISVFNSTSLNWTSYTTSNGLVNKEVKTIIHTSSGNTWVGTEKGISVFNPISGIWTPYINVLVSKDIKNIFQDSNGNIWIATDKGVNLFNGSSWIQYTVTNGLISNKVKSIFQDNSGNIWFITKKGLSKLINGVFINYPNGNNTGIYVVYKGTGITVIGIN